MKDLLIFLLALVLAALPARAGQLLLPAGGPYLAIYTNRVVATAVTNPYNIVSATNFNALTTTNTVDTAATTQHTFQMFFNSTGSNACTVTGLRTIDNVNYVTWMQTNFVVNAATNSVTSTNAEWTSTGKWLKYEFIVWQVVTNWGTNNVILNEMSQ
jgi:ABC-type protease/lipase transport system fused ATPase/permease subunit